MVFITVCLRKSLIFLILSSVRLFCDKFKRRTVQHFTLSRLNVLFKSSILLSVRLFLERSNSSLMFGLLVANADHSCSTSESFNLLLCKFNTSLLSCSKRALDISITPSIVMPIEPRSSRIDWHFLSRIA